MLGIARKGFVMKDKQADLRPPRDPQGHHVELPDRTSGPLPLLHAPPLQYTQNPDVSSSKDQDKEGLPRGRTHACRHHQQTSYGHLQLAQGLGQCRSSL